MDRQKLDVLYDLVVELQQELERQVAQPVAGRVNVVRTLAAAYQLQDYAANELAK